MSERVIHVDVGVFGKRWCTELLKTNVADGTIEVVVVVDSDPKHLPTAERRSRSRHNAVYSDPATAFADTEADFCTVVVTPAQHENVIDIAVARGLDILCEKPIADTMEASIRIARKVAAAGRNMAVTMSHRFDQDKTTLRRIVRSGILGKINAIGFLFRGDMQQHMAWSSLFRHQMRDPLLIEGVIHHLDIIADLAGSRCETLFATTWKPDWAEDAGDTDGIVTMSFENGTRAVYVSNAVGLNTFYKEYIGVDGELGTAVLNHRDLEIFMRQDVWRQQHREGQGQKIPLLAQPNGSTTGS
jgi:predicted dehydrogenase